MKTSEVNRETENHTEVKPSKADFEKNENLIFCCRKYKCAQKFKPLITQKYYLCGMIESTNAKINRLIVHRIGCKTEGEPLCISKTEMNTTEYEEVSDILKNFFFKSFKTEAYFNMTHEEGLNMNMVYNHVSDIFDDPSNFYEMSINIASQLYECSNHARIRGGEFYMAYFTGCVVDGEVCDAVGIFKSENKETFLKVYMSNDDNIELGAQEGINIRKLDKGCIVFNTEREDGYKVCAVDNINRGQEARFWMQDFLGLKPREDNFFYTDNYMQLCKGFVRDIFNEQNNVHRTDQIELINRSLDFFQNTPQFNNEDFENRVMIEPDIIQAFDAYKQEYETQNNMPEPLPTSFDISKDAVKQDKKHFKTIIKLDKNFHIYVHGSRYFMEKNYDAEKDMNYYKLYFKSES